MPAPLMKIEATPSLPEQVDVVVIGGGIVGVCSAYYLARRGIRVALVEKGLVGAEQSSRNWGWCRQQNRDGRELPIATRSLSLWENFAEEIGESTGFKRCGLLYLSNNEAEIEQWANWRDFARTVGVTTNMLSASDAKDYGRATGQTWKGGVFSPSDGTADPGIAVPVIAKGVIKAGGTVHQMCAARGLEMEAGRVSGVITEKGTIRTRAVVLAGGAWASSFCRQLGIRFPQASVRSSILSVAPGGHDLPHALHTADVSVTRRLDGSHTLAISGLAKVDPTLQQLRFSKDFMPMFAKRRASLALGDLTGWRSGHETLAKWRLDAPTPMEKNRILDPAPDRGVVDETLRRARKLLPALGAVGIAHAWAGYIDSTPDGVPAIGEIHTHPGLFLAAGFSGHGFGIGPGAGHLVADLVTNATPIVDPKPYHPDRLAKSVRGKVAEF